MYLLRVRVSMILQIIPRLKVPTRWKSSSVEHRMKFAEKTQDDLCGQSVLKVYSNGSNSLSKTVLLQSKSLRILFNCGETADMSHKGDLDAIFVTHLNWSNIGGIPSICLKFSQTCKKTFKFYGPPGLDWFMHHCKAFLPNDNIKISIEDCSLSSKTMFENLEVKSVPIKEALKKPYTPSPVNKSYICKEDHRYPHGKSVLTKQPKDKVVLDTSIAYICKFHTPRAWLLSECVKRGVKPGPDMHKLWRGDQIILDDGSVIKPVDVIRVESYSIIVVIDCPTQDYLEDLIEKEEFEETFKDENLTPTIVVHFTPSSVMKDKRYIAWMDSCPPGTKHLIVNDSNDWNAPQKVVNRQNVCRQLSPQFFPELKGSLQLSYPDITPVDENMCLEDDGHPKVIKETTSESWLKKWINLPSSLHLIQSWCGTIMDLSSRKVFRESESLQISSLPSFLKTAKVCGEVTNTYSGNNAPKYPTITFLGTGSQSSTVYRNSSGILIQISSNKRMLLDCGDGIMHQLTTLYGPLQVQEVLRSLKCIYISHPHADHHAGLIGILSNLRKAQKAARSPPEKLLLLLPVPLLDFIVMYHNKFEPVLDNVLPILVSDLISAEEPLKSKIRNLVMDQLDMKYFLACRASHCPYSYCIAFKHDNGWKISYSGDTMASNYFTKIGLDSDLLIHEATYASKLSIMAHTHRHSTTEEAITAGRKMGAKHVLLTHFSKRYPIVPFLKELKNYPNVSVAFDFLQVSLKDLQVLPRLNDTYEIVFEDYERDNEEQTEKLEERHKEVNKLLKFKNSLNKRQ